MIPKKIHYCWFGRNPLPELAVKCIDSWKKYCPDYEIIQWNEDNFDINCNNYVKEAYNAKKWAFVSDYIRLYAVYNFGGVYMDTDVEVIKNIDVFLKHPAFTGFESKEGIITGIIAGEKNNKWFGLLLDYYNDANFINNDGSYNLTTNVTIASNITKANYNVKFNNKFQNLNNDVFLYPTEYFCPKDYMTLKINITQNTYTIHHFNGSWVPEEARKEREEVRPYIIKYGKRLGYFIFNSKNEYKRGGILQFIKWFISRLLNKIKKCSED